MRPPSEDTIKESKRHLQWLAPSLLIGCATGIAIWIALAMHRPDEISPSSFLSAAIVGTLGAGIFIYPINADLLVRRSISRAMCIEAVVLPLLCGAIALIWNNPVLPFVLLFLATPLLAKILQHRLPEITLPDLPPEIDYLCENCSYDLRGLKGTRCPECGERIPPPG